MLVLFTNEVRECVIQDRYNSILNLLFKTN